MIQETVLRPHGSVAPCNGPLNDGLWTEVYRAGATGPFSRFRDLGREMSFVDRDVEVGGTYRYYAKTYNASGQRSLASATQTVTVTDVLSPSTPDISGTVSGTIAQLSWDFGKDYDLFGYNIYRSTTSGGPYTKLTMGGAVRAASFTAQLPDSSTYYFIVKAVDSNGLESDPSSEVTLVPDP